MRLPALEDLPKVSFRRVDDDLSKPVVGVSDTLDRSFGCTRVLNKCVFESETVLDCDGSDFKCPAHYIRHTGRHCLLVRALLTSDCRDVGERLAPSGRV